MNPLWRYIPLRTMLEPEGGRIMAAFRWLYFKNQFTHPVHGPATIVRVMGWERTSLSRAK